MGTFQARVDDHLILPARVRLPAGDEHFLRHRGQSVPAAVTIRLLIDTGATRSTLSPGILRHLDPTAGHDVHVNTPSEPITSALYWVCLDFPGTRLTGFNHVQVARLEMPRALRHLDGLLGRDVLRIWDEFRYQGRRGRYVIHETPGLFGWLRRWL
jgi:hypothetical protein